MTIAHINRTRLINGWIFQPNSLRLEGIKFIKEKLYNGEYYEYTIIYNTVNSNG
jgi:hypothetical protein